MFRTESTLQFIAVATLLLGLPNAAVAQEPQLLGEFTDWSAYAYDSEGAKVCYVVSQPKKQEPAGLNRDPAYFLVTHRPADKVRNEVNTIIGYPFKKESSATITIDGTDFQLFTKGDGAWADSSGKDSDIVEAMKKGRDMVIKGTSWRGTGTSDTYSLSGVSAAISKIDTTCK